MMFKNICKSVRACFNFLEMSRNDLMNDLMKSNAIYLKHMYRWLVGVCLLCVAGLPLRAQSYEYQRYLNVIPSVEAQVVGCVMQDGRGLIWMGSNKGLYSYDGYTMQPHYVQGDATNVRINCGVYANDSCLYLGADNGLLVYDTYADAYRSLGVDTPHDIRALAWHGDKLWMGTLDGLYVYSRTDCRVVRLSEGLPHHAIYALLHTTDGTLYVGTYNGLCRYDEQRRCFVPIALPAHLHRSNCFVNVLYEDPARHCIWIGMEGALLQYWPALDKVDELPGFEQNSVKSLSVDRQGCVLAGTDNGLYVWHQNGMMQHVVHDARHSYSLSNNIVWSIMTDAEGNVWLGTDGGASFCNLTSPLQYLSIAQITGRGDGNQLYQLMRDADGTFWMGGTNGLLGVGGFHAHFHSPLVKPDQMAWYQVGAQPYTLRHNRIRHLYQDRDRQLWIATDGGIARFDSEKREFIPYYIVDASRRYNANWAYHIYEDAEGRLWVATCLGGVMVVDKKRLMQAGSRLYVADAFYSLENGLPGMFVSQLVPDKQGCLWLLFYNTRRNVACLNLSTGKVEPLLLDELSDTQVPGYLLCADDGTIWVGFHGGVARVNPADGTHKTLLFDTTHPCEVLAMAQHEGTVWVSTTDGIWAVDEAQMYARRLQLSEKRFTAMYYDRRDSLLYLGGTDELAVARPKDLLKTASQTPVMLTSLYVNNRRYPTQGTEGVRYLRRLVLSHREGNLSFVFSDLPYALDEKNIFTCRMEGLDETWRELPAHANRVTYNNLVPGNYRLQVSKLDAYGRPLPPSFHLDIAILPPWYLTWWAKAIYWLLFIGLAAWAINFFRMKHSLKQARRDKQRVMEQMELKMHLFGTLSEGLKAPLGEIAVNVGQLNTWVHSNEEVNVLEKVWNNLEQLDNLIHEALDTPVSLVRPALQKAKEDRQPEKQQQPEVPVAPVLQPEAVQLDVESADEKFMHQVSGLIEAHLSDFDLNVSALAEWTGVNQKQLYRKVKQFTGMTPVEYIRSIRMKTAARLLGQQKFTVSEVMYLVGFSNSSYFSKCFQAEYGVSPKNYTSSAS